MLPEFEPAKIDPRLRTTRCHPCEKYLADHPDIVKRHEKEIGDGALERLTHCTEIEVNSNRFMHTYMPGKVLHHEVCMRLKERQTGRLPKRPWR